MPLPTSRQPPGLLSFFGVKNGGRNPQFAMDSYIATIDCLDWALADPLAFVDLLVTGISVSGQGFLVADINQTRVPNGQVWILTEATVTSNIMGAGQALGACPAFSEGGPSPGTYALGPTVVAVNGGHPTSVCAGSTPPVRRFLKPLTQVGMYISDLAAGPITAQFHMRYVPVQI